MVWPLVIFCIVLAGFFYMRMRARAESDRRMPDAGMAIVDFGRAFPGEAIRAIHATIDGKAFFVRLHNGKAGFMASHGAHFVCHLLEPGRASVNSAASGRGLEIRFADFAYLDGTFEFATPEIAAEVSLWLLGSFAPRTAIRSMPSA